MDFKDYINGLNDLDNQEARTELETFYTLNATTFKFFKALDATILNLLMQSNVNVIAKQQLEEILPTLIKLRSEILDIDSITYARGYKTKIEKAISYIKNQMVVNEVTNNAHNLFELLDNNKNAIKNEKITSEKKLSPLQKAEQIVLKQGVYACSTEMLWKLAWKSKNTQLLETIAKESDGVDIECEIISRTLEDRVSYYETYYPYHSWSEMDVNSINCVIADNPNASSLTLKKLANDRNILVVLHVAGNSNTPREVLDSLATHNNDDVRAAVAENPATPLSVMQKLACDQKQDVRYATARNNNISAEILQILAIDEDPTIRYLIAANSSTPPHILKILSKDKEGFVSYAAKSHPNYVKEGCFIATACYGDYDAPEVLILRKYRDDQLLTNCIGTIFVKFYYAVSPYFAKKIEKSDKLKMFMRKSLLRPIVKRIQYKFSDR